MKKTVAALIGKETNLISNLANFSAWYKEAYSPHWCGFYLVDKEFLTLGPFQGPVACTRIKMGSGVCGRAAATLAVQNVPDVHAFPGHIACSPHSNSELVIPLINKGEVWAVFDVDRTEKGLFDGKHISELEEALNVLHL